MPGHRGPHTPIRLVLALLWRTRRLPVIAAAALTFGVAGGCTLLLRSSVPQIRVSDRPDRSVNTPLDAATQIDTISVFVDLAAGVTAASFFLDDPTITHPPTHATQQSPVDFMGTQPDGTAVGFNTATLRPGAHSLTVSLQLATGSTEAPPRRGAPFRRADRR